MNENFSIGEINFGVDQSTNKPKRFLLNPKPLPDIRSLDVIFNDRILPIVRSKTEKPKRELFLESFLCSIPRNGNEIIVFGKKPDGTKIVKSMEYNDLYDSQKLFFENNDITHWIFDPFSDIIP